MHEAGMADMKFHKVTAHQAQGDRTWQEQANEWADYYASLGRELHEPPTDAMKNQLRFAAEELGKVVQLVVHVFSKWPTQARAGRLPPRERAAAKAQPARSDGHRWQKQNGRWQCSRCLATTSRPSHVANHCKASAEADGGFVADLQARGHRPIEVQLEQGNKLWICSSCGKYVQTKKKTIQEQCPSAAGPYGKATLARVASGSHPDTHVIGAGSKVIGCWDCTANRAISHTALKAELRHSARATHGPRRMPARRPK